MQLFKFVRILLLLAIFISVAFYSKHQKLKSRSWTSPLQVVIYPINAERSAGVDEYIRTLDNAVFTEIDEFFQREGKVYSVMTAQPFLTRLGSPISDIPPDQPAPDAGMPAIAWWSLKLRYWAFRHTPDSDSNVRRVRVFLLYHEMREHRVMQHSLGLDKGLLTIVHAFAAEQQEAQNNLVIAHELLHTVGAGDKYGMDNQPIFPDGYADTGKEPLYPQTEAEIMAGRIPLSDSRAAMAENLRQCVIGEKTAEEINWIAPAR